MTRFKEFKWQLFAMALLIFGLMMAKGGMLAIRPLLRFALPAGLVYLVYREGKRRFMSLVGDRFRSQIQDAMRRSGYNGTGPMGGAPGPGPGAGNHQVIDLCPKCGAYLTAKHRCAK